MNWIWSLESAQALGRRSRFRVIAPAELTKANIEMDHLLNWIRFNPSVASTGHLISHLQFPINPKRLLIHSELHENSQKELSPKIESQFESCCEYARKDSEPTNGQILSEWPNYRVFRPTNHGRRTLTIKLAIRWSRPPQNVVHLNMFQD